MPLTKLWERNTSRWKHNIKRDIIVCSIATNIYFVFVLLFIMISYTRADGNATMKNEYEILQKIKNIERLSKINTVPPGDHQKSSRSVKTFANVKNNSLSSYLDNNHRKSLFSRESLKKNLVNKGDKSISEDSSGKELTSSWAIRLLGELNSDHIVSKIAEDLGLISHGNIGHLPGHYLLVHRSFYNHSSKVERKIDELRSLITDNLKSHPHVDWVRHEVVLKRYKRSLQFKDQFFPSQWHLVSIFLR